jgi:predicted outer membrane repeat protein
VVGTGAGTCTEAALQAAVAKGGVITFNCGGAATLAVTAELKPPQAVDTVLDGGGVITLDGQHQTRILHFDGGDYRKTMTHVTLQRLRFVNGKASGSALPSAPAPCSQGTDIDGGGGAVLVRDGILHVLDSSFEGNQAASVGPDVAGGAINGQGALEVIVAGSQFKNNSASNGGALGMLNTTLSTYDCTFEGNQATGTGGNTIDTSKCTKNGGEVGDGGDGGAISIDGGDDLDDVVCGSVFRGNQAGTAGTFFRVCDKGVHKTTFDRTTFDGNTAKTAGGVYLHHVEAVIVASTFSGNTAEGGGGFRAEDTTIDFTNVTFTGNAATKGLGGALLLFGNGGKLTNCTFAQNHADGGSGLFGAAIGGGTALTIDNTLFSGNTSMDCGAPMACQDGASTGAANLQFPQKHLVCSNDDAACAAGITFADPLLGALGDHGGPTQTLVPGAGSPAIGLGKGCPATDQRGKARPSEGCTAGAVEAM